MRDVAVVSFAQSIAAEEPERNEVEILMPVVAQAVERSGIPKEEIGFTCSGSADFLAGQPFAFVNGLEAIGAWPPIRESHLEMDGAWALYEAWVRLQHGDVDSALVYGFGKSSMGSLRDVLAVQLDPYYLAPLWPDAISLAALQARAVLEGTDHTEREMAEVAARTTGADVDDLLSEPFVVSPLRRHDIARVADGAAAVVLAAGDLAREVAERPVWIRGIDHRVEPHSLGARDLTRSSSTEIAARAAGVNGGGIDVAELYAPFTHQELLLRDALGLNGETVINPSGGALATNPMMAAGLIRIGEAAARIADGSANRALAHATSGACLQQNLVCVLEA